MIKVIRAEIPDFFGKEKFKRYLEELMSFKKEFSQQRVQFRAEALKPVKPYLMKMFRSKCAYCESSLGTVSYGDIDNFRPKGGVKGFDKAYSADHYWWLAYEWDNLYLSCQICNGKYKCNWFPLENEKLRAVIGAKGAELLSEKALLLDPCYDEPELHLRFAMDGMVHAITPRGKATIDILGLNRRELVEMRLHATRNLLLQLDHYKDMPKIKKSLKSYIDKLFSPSPPQQYAAVERSVFKFWYSKNKDVWDSDNTEQLSSLLVTDTSRKAEQRSVKTGIQRVEDKLANAIRRFSIKSVEINNFRNVHHLKMNIPPSAVVSEGERQESWLLMLGDNGAGKSSILQAIALTLVGAKELKKLAPLPKDLLRKGATAGSVIIQSYEHDTPVRLDFDKNNVWCSLEEAPTFILGYGSIRLLPRGGVKAPGKRADCTNVCNLFDYSAALADVNKWLRGISPEDFEQRISPALFDLLDLQQDEKVVLSRGRLLIYDAENSYELEKVSDGFKSIIAMACDIMKSLWIDGAGYHTVQGIVLIDELGNHLHPKWRLKIVGALRKAFPKLQFIVSTHEPLCLRGLAHGEVTVLMDKPGSGVTMLDSNDLPDHNLLSVDQLLTSDLFGLLDTLDMATQQIYHEYYALLGKMPSKRTPEDKKKIEAYQKKLTRNEVLGEKPRDQILLTVIDEVWATKIKEKGFKTVTQLKEETVSTVKNMLTEKSIDWL